MDNKPAQKLKQFVLTGHSRGWISV